MMSDTIALLESSLEPGQRFRAADGSMWEFKGYAPTHTVVRHVTLVSLEEGFSPKIISIAALLDKRLFTPVGEGLARTLRSIQERGFFTRLKETLGGKWEAFGGKKAAGAG